MKIFFCAVLCCLMSACGTEHKFKLAEKLEKEEAYLDAVRIYDEIAASSSEKSAEALFKSAEIYRKHLVFYPEAVSRYTLVYELYPGETKWAQKAKMGILQSPDYFPLHEGNKWVEVDSQTGGSNMREERVCFVNLETQATYIRRRVYAGNKLVTGISGDTYYEKAGLEIREYENYAKNIYKVILKYPFEKGAKWESVEAGRRVYFEIADTDVVCKVRAGEIRGCIKVRQTFERMKAVKYTYYAPMIGRVLTTTKGSMADSETRNAELRSFIINK